MAHRVVEIPGGTTSDDIGMEVRVVAKSDQPTTFIFKYVAAGTEEHPVFGEITFAHVLEYRWIAEFVEYEDFPEHERDGSLGLVEILDSRYIENMASKAQLRDYPGKRLGLGIKEDEVKHYRLGVDDHGRYDIICLGVVIKEIAG